jgi:hypothetical protein
MIKYIWMTEMTDPIFHWEKIEKLAIIGEPIIVYSKAKVPIQFFCDNPHIGLNITITGWGSTWLEPLVPKVNLMIDHLNELTTKIDLNRIKLRIDPGIPTIEGINRAISVIKNVNPLPKVITSIIQFYNGHSSIFNKLNIDRRFYTIKSGRAIFPEKTIANRWLECLLQARPDAIKLISFCGMPYDISKAEHYGCVDEDLLKAIGVNKFLKIAPGIQRPGCKCVIRKKQACSGFCDHGCKYCYAHKEHIN